MMTVSLVNQNPISPQGAYLLEITSAHSERVWSTSSLYLFGSENRQFLAIVD